MNANAPYSCGLGSSNNLEHRKLKDGTQSLHLANHRRRVPADGGAAQCLRRPLLVATATGVPEQSPASLRVPDPNGNLDLSPRPGGPLAPPPRFPRPPGAVT